MCPCCTKEVSEGTFWTRHLPKHLKDRPPSDTLRAFIAGHGRRLCQGGLRTCSASRKCNTCKGEAIYKSRAWVLKADRRGVPMVSGARIVKREPGMVSVRYKNGIEEHGIPDCRWKERFEKEEPPLAWEVEVPLPLAENGLPHEREEGVHPAPPSAPSLSRPKDRRLLPMEKPPVSTTRVALKGAAPELRTMPR